MTVLIGDSAHYKRDYQDMVRRLMTEHSVDEAMSLAVGGSYEECGIIQVGLLNLLGMENVHSMIDIGCGSGRLASRLARTYKGQYLGIEIVAELLDYADAKTPRNFHFEEVGAIKIPAADNSADLVTAFSVFTHLLHEESFIYLEEIKRVLKPGGRFVFSFLELAAPNHWDGFRGSVELYRNGKLPALNMITERQTIDAWRRMLGFDLDTVINGWEDAIPIEEPIRFESGHVAHERCPFGQSVAVFRKPLN